MPPTATLGASATHGLVRVHGRGQAGLTQPLWSPRAAGLLLPPLGTLVLEPDLGWAKTRLEISRRVFLHPVPSPQKHDPDAFPGTGSLQFRKLHSIRISLAQEVCPLRRDQRSEPSVPAGLGARARVEQLDAI